ncbi:TPA: hypothetical protein ACT5CR_005913 [Burkholderia cenocepacia]|uniref:Uncharacterized protein n=1 Tax=Burkholderia arboris TaxID=488730 RepID=A0A9Q9UPA5_9BURK|nr:MULTISPECIES: hypothetical protein [Burkholderia cepacia complex]MCW3686835.1 hypothetical protein [Burkholderia cenocepacia]QUN38911.1 hypothetical protein KEH56_12085 [Burkholderia cenocepacia]QUO29186.1 hypothetical protein KEH57_36175 [Burkholderia cenocepacia]VWB28301.1 hypothetical protein BAR24066_01187 [Burkholderia arboris]
MASAGRKPSAEATRLVQLTLPVQVDAALERISKIGFYGRSKSEVVVTLLSREFERIARDGLLDRLEGLTK